MKDAAISAEDVSAGSHSRVWSECERGHRWKTFVYALAAGNGCPSCSTSFSKAESEIAGFVESRGLKVVNNDRSLIPPKELDIFIPEKRIAIEFNGLWWHSERAGRGRRYHYDKWKACRDRGVQLLTVWEDDWRDRPEIVKSGLAHKLGADSSAHIGARTCEIVDVSPVEARSFLAAHHIQGASSGSVRIGLEHDGELVAVMLMKKRSGDEWELVRYATSATVVGGQSRLLHHFESTHSPSSIVTFADHEVSNGGLYARTGWVVDGEVPPDYRYVYGGRRQHKFGFRKERFERDPNLLFEPGLTESELAELNGIPRVWDCGKTRWRRR